MSLGAHAPSRAHFGAIAEMLGHKVRDGGAPSPAREGACAPQTSAAEGAHPGDVATNDQRVNVVRAFVSIHGFEVHQVPDYRIAIGDPSGPEDVARLAR